MTSGHKVVGILRRLTPSVSPVINTGQQAPIDLMLCLTRTDTDTCCVCSGELILL